MLLARSMMAAAVSFCTLYSFVTDVASLNAVRETSTCSRTMSTFCDIVASTPTIRAPSEPRALNASSRLCILPASFILSRIRSIASMVLPEFTSWLIVPSSIFNAFSMAPGDFCKAERNIENAVPLVSIERPAASAAEPSASISAVESFKYAAIPWVRCPKSTIAEALDALDCVNSFMALPICRIPFSTDSAVPLNKPITSPILARGSIASSPRSSPRATLI